MFVKGTPEYFMQIARHKWIKKNIVGHKPSCIVIKTTQDCNLRCKYCYTEGGRNKRDISPETIIKLFDQLAVDNTSELVCTFHGGEPLLRPYLIAETIEKLKQKYYGPRIKYQIQTNGTLITDQAIELIRKYNIDIGISIDGYKSLNDCTRIYPDGSSSYENVEKGIQKLFENNIMFGALLLITKHNVNHLTEILEWCEKIGLDRIGFNTFTPLGYGKEENLAPDLNDLIENVINEIDWLIKHNQQELNTAGKLIYEREIESLVVRILNPEKCAHMCTDIPCGAGKYHLGIDVDGSVNICDCFYGIDDFIIGNINTQSLDEILQNPLVYDFNARTIDKLEGCQNCDIKHICHGGCPSHNVLFLNSKDGLYKKSYKCNYYTKIYKYLIQKLEIEQINPALLAEMYLEEKK